MKHSCFFYRGTLQKPTSRWSLYYVRADVKQQASAVGLYCFWFACDHANPLLHMYPFPLVCFCLIILFYWLKFEFVRHSLWTGWMYQLSGERRSGLHFGLQFLVHKKYRQTDKNKIGAGFLMRRTTKQIQLKVNSQF